MDNPSVPHSVIQRRKEKERQGKETVHEEGDA